MQPFDVALTGLPAPLLLAYNPFPLAHLTPQVRPSGAGFCLRYLRCKKAGVVTQALRGPGVIEQGFRASAKLMSGQTLDDGTEAGRALQ